LAVLLAGGLNYNPQGGRTSLGFAPPKPFACMPCAFRFLYPLIYISVAIDHEMGAEFMGIQHIKIFFYVLGIGVMQHQKRCGLAILAVFEMSGGFFNDLHNNVTNSFNSFS